MPETIFSEMSRLALEHDAINLGQGFPDTPGPREVVDAAVAAMHRGLNQYPPAVGVAPLREAIAEHQRRFYGLTVDPATEVSCAPARRRRCRPRWSGCCRRATR